MTAEQGSSQSPTVWVEASPQEQRVESGQTALIAIVVENRGPSAESYSMSVDGLPSAWVTIEFESRRRLFPRERRSGLVRLQIPAGETGGRRSLRVLAEAPGQAGFAECWLDVQAPEGAASGPSVSLQPAQVVTPPGREERVGVEIRNLGSTPISCALAVEGVPATWWRSGGPIDVPARGLRTGELWLAAASTATGHHEFEVVVEVVGTDVRVATAGSLILEGTTGIEAPLTGFRPTTPLSTVQAATQAPPDLEPTGARGVTSAPPATPVRPPTVFLSPSTFFRLRPTELSTQALLTVENTSSIDDSYRVQVIGLPEGWSSLSIDEVLVPAGSSKQVAVRVRPRPGPENPAGEYQCRIAVQPRGYPDAAATIAAQLILEGRNSFDAKVEPPMASGRSATYAVTVSNTGTVASPFVIGGHDPEGLLNVAHVESQSIDVSRTGTASLKVRPRSLRLIGSPETFDFSVEVAPAGAEGLGVTRRYSARFVQRPFVSGRVPFLIGFYALIGFIALLGAWLLPSPVTGAIGWAGCNILKLRGVQAQLPQQIPGQICGAQVSQVSSTATPASKASSVAKSASPTSPASPQCGSLVAQKRPELKSGVQVFVASETIVRAGPKRDPTNVKAQVVSGQSSTTKLPQETLFKVLEGPVCEDSLIWWKVSWEVPPGTPFPAESRKGEGFVAESFVDKDQKDPTVLLSPNKNDVNHLLSDLQ